MKKASFSILGLLSILNFSFAQETYQLQERYPLNQPISYEMKFEFTLNLTQSSPTGQDETNLSNQSFERYTDTYTQLDAAGFPIQARRDYQTAQSIQNGQEVPVTYNGKTVYLQKVGDQTQASSPGSTLSPEDIENLQDELPNPDSQAILPTRPVKVGETWIANERAIVKLLGLDENTRGTLKERLVSAGPFANQNCALLEINLVATTNQGGMDLSVDLTGKVYFSLDQNRIISAEFQGPMQASGQTTTDQGPVQIQGQGQMQGYFKQI